MLKAHKDARAAVKFKKKMVVAVGKDVKHVKLKLMSRAQKKEQRCIAKEMRDCKAAVKAVEKDEKLNKPLRAFWLWQIENREQAVSLVGGKPSDVAKQLGKLWKNLSENDKAPYEARSKKMKSDYDSYVATPDGAAALKAYKVATAAVAYTEKVVEKDAEEPMRKKPRWVKAGDSSPTTPKTKPITKKCAKREADVKPVEAEEEPVQKKKKKTPTTTPKKAEEEPPTTPKKKKKPVKEDTAKKVTIFRL